MTLRLPFKFFVELTGASIVPPFVPPPMMQVGVTNSSRVCQDCVWDDPRNGLKIRVSAVQLPICQNDVRVTARVTQLAVRMKCPK
jgi:hypothetical protein